jgi:sterol 14alpha-demethylase
MNKVPPVVSGALPVVGHIPQFFRNRETLLKRGCEEHGPVFSIRIPDTVAVIGGSQLNRWFYSETDHALSSEKSYEFMRAAVGEVLLTAPRALSEAQRPVLKVIFSNERMRGYIEAMNAEVDRWLASLGDSGKVEISEAMRHLTQYVAGRAFLGGSFREEIGEDFWQAYADLGASLDPVFPPHWPLPKFRRRDRGKQVIRDVLGPICEKRRRDPATYDDALSIIATTPAANGGPLPQEQVVQYLVSLLFAGHETTAGQAAWSIILTLQHAPVQRKLEALVRELPKDASLTAKSLRALDYAYHIIDETTRTRPSADLQIRMTEEPVEIAGYHIPKGRRVMVSSAVSHYLSAQFRDPDRFDPERFTPERGEGDDAFAVVGFGGGKHKCTGIHFARHEMVIILAKLFNQYGLELITEKTHVATGYGANRPSPTYVRYKRRA